MSIVSTTVLAFSMSADAFAASISKGAALQKPRLRDAAFIGLVFGGVETITPIIGWVAGLAASSFITSIDHWIAFLILGAVGGKMLFEGLQAHKEKPAEPQRRTGRLVLTAIGTSIDAMAVGVTLAFMDLNIWVSALAIGFATFLMATIGIMTGHYIGAKAGRAAEALGGLALISIGSNILWQHLTAA